MTVIGENKQGNNKNDMEKVNQHPDLTINQVAVKYGIDYTVN